MGGIGVERFGGVLLLWEVLTPVFPVFQLFGKLKDRVNVMPSARAARGARGWPVRKSSNEEYTVSGKLTKIKYVFYIVGMMTMWQSRPQVILAAWSRAVAKWAGILGSVGG